MISEKDILHFDLYEHSEKLRYGWLPDKIHCAFLLRAGPLVLMPLWKR